MEFKLISSFKFAATAETIKTNNANWQKYFSFAFARSEFRQWRQKMRKLFYWFWMREQKNVTRFELFYCFCDSNLNLWSDLMEQNCFFDAKIIEFNDKSIFNSNEKVKDPKILSIFSLHTRENRQRNLKILIQTSINWNSKFSCSINVQLIDANHRTAATLIAQIIDQRSSTQSSLNVKFDSISLKLLCAKKTPKILTRFLECS